MSVDRKWKGTDPAERLGIYKRLADVPDRYRLSQHADAYADRDVWSEFMAHERAEHGFDSERYERNAKTCERRWTEHMAERGRHPALATPADVESFAVGLLDRVKIRTAYSVYWTRLEAFYDYLTWHVDHPHRYHSVLMAAAEYPDGAARTIWDDKISRYDSESA